MLKETETHAHTFSAFYYGLINFLFAAAKLNLLMALIMPDQL